MKPRMFCVYKPDGSQVRVLLLPFKGTTECAFVNLTKGHICSCRFKDETAAIDDMQMRVTKGLIDDYEELSPASVIF